MNLKTRFALLAATLSLAIAAPAPAADIEPPLRPETFADDMVHAVGAKLTDCKTEVVRQVEAHDMKAVCARFDGDFERFALRWSLKLAQEMGDEDELFQWSRAEPTTDWELTNDAVYDRIYRVGTTAVGVRFSLGDLLLIW